MGDKKGLAQELQRITRVPEDILENGLEGSRPCVAQIISWAAYRTTTRVEDRAYSLIGLLDVNMPMLYGEGKKAFHRLQLEIIRSSNDQSIFAWGHNSEYVRIGSILADDPSDFKDCSDMKLMDHDEFMDAFPTSSSAADHVDVFPITNRLSSTNADHFGVFPITNRGIQIWMPLRRYRDSDCVFRAYLPCRGRSGCSATYIDLVLWDSNYYKYPLVARDATLEDSPVEFHQVYLRYQDIPNHAVTFDIDDSAIIANGFTCSREAPTNLTGNAFTLTNINPFCVKTYSQERHTHDCFQVDFGQCFGLDWVHLDVARNPVPWIDGALRLRMPGGALSMVNYVVCFRRLWVCHLQLPGSTWVVRIYRVVWERSKIRLRMEVFRGSHSQNCLDGWNAYYVEVSDSHVHMDHH